MNKQDVENNPLVEVTESSEKTKQKIRQLLSSKHNAQKELEILAEVHQWLDSDVDAYNRFWTYLSERLRSRDPYYRDTENQYELYYLGLYELGDFTATKDQVESE